MKTDKTNKSGLKKNKSEEQVVQEPRKLKMPKYQRGKFQKRIKHPGPKLASSWTIFTRAIKNINNNRKLFTAILAIYAGLSLLLVRGFNSTMGLSDAKAKLQASNSGAAKIGADLFSGLLTRSNSNPGTGATYQTLLFILMSLVVIWALRHVHGKVIRPAPIKAAFYKSTNSFVPFVLVLLVIALQFIPLLLGSGLYGLMVGGGIAVTGPEHLISLLVLLMLATWTLYMVAGSLFAMYIVTLPNVGPRQALRSSRQLVQFRRWTVLRKVIALPLILFLLLVVLMLPFIFFLTGLAEWVFFVLSLATLIVGHSYYYCLYRELV